MEFFTFQWVSDPQIWLSLITLSALEIVLGIDNLVFQIGRASCRERV